MARFFTLFRNQLPERFIKACFLLRKFPITFRSNDFCSRVFLRGNCILHGQCEQKFPSNQNVRNLTISSTIFEEVRKRFPEYILRQEKLLQDLSSNKDISPKELELLSRELSDISAITTAVQELQKKEADLAGLLEFLDEVVSAEEEQELKKLATEEKEETEEQISALKQQILALVVPKDKDDFRGAIIEIRAGTGGDEAGLFTSEILQMYRKFSALNGWKASILQISETNVGGCKDATLAIQGSNVYRNLKFESGIHRVQRVPVNDVKLQTSAVSVVVFPEIADKDFQINPSDLKIDTFRSSGAGGQHVNTTDSAVRITHLPTGTVVSVQDERSQIQNRAKAMKILNARIYENEKQKAVEKQNLERKVKIGSGDRSDRIRTYNFPQDRITDHRTGYSIFNVLKVMNGEGLEFIIKSLVEEEAKQKLELLFSGEVDQ